MSAFDYSKPYMDNTVVGYHGDKVIVKQDDRALLFCEIPSNLKNNIKTQKGKYL